ncbi:MAG: nitrous oxide reductase accessory protein NosL [Desulfobaccales bacterium]
MKKGILAGSLLAILVLTGAAALAQVAADIQKFPECKYCGMDRQKFAHSRILIEYTDGSGFGACSLHCAALDLAQNIDKTPKAILVADYQTKNLIDAEKAYWVIGGNKTGVMTNRAKWAFADQKEAEAFVKENEGKLSSFDDAMKATYEDMYADTKMIRERRAKRKLRQQGHQP